MEQLAFEVVLFDGPYQFRVTEIDGQLEKVEAWQDPSGWHQIPFKRLPTDTPPAADR